MKRRNTHFEKKYKKAKSYGDFFVYTFNSGVKSNLNLALNREFYLIGLKSLNIPSSFKLEKVHNTQGPIINMIYGYNLNFTKLNYVEKLQLLGLKKNNLIYSHKTLKDVVTYKNPNNLCYSVNSNIWNKLIDFSVLSFLIQKVDNSLH